jgi:hypothetical protein
MKFWNVKHDRMATPVELCRIGLHDPKSFQELESLTTPWGQVMRRVRYPKEFECTHCGHRWPFVTGFEVHT